VYHKISCLGNAEISAELDIGRYDVVIFPGGKTSAQLQAIDDLDVLVVQTFVRNGGGFLGICAGGVLAMERFEFFGDVFQKHPWDRGMGNVTVEFTNEGLNSLLLPDESRFSKIFYGQGPIVAPELLPDKVKVLAYFRNEICYRHTEVTECAMIDTPAILKIRYGLGDVLVSSGHPELTAAPSGAPHLWVGTDAQIAMDLYHGFLACLAPRFFE
jgi:glutamine amidotransferase-like uncharacterized protein